MNIRLTKAAHERFVTEQVQSGQYATPEAVIEDAIERVMHESLTDEDIAAITESEEQIDRGDCVDLQSFAAESRKKHGLSK